MEFTFEPQWVHSKDKSIVCHDEADFKVLIEGGYTDSPKAAKEGKKHPAYEFYFEKSGTKKPEYIEPKVDSTIYEVETLSWPELKKYAKKLEGVFKTDIVSRHSKKEDVLKKIKELRNGNSSKSNK